MATFNLSTAQGRKDFSTNQSLEFAFVQALVEKAGASLASPGNGSAFPYSGKVAFTKIEPFLRQVFSNGIRVNPQILLAFIATLPQVSVDEDNLTTSLYSTLLSRVEDWIEYRQGVSASDKTTDITP